MKIHLRTTRRKLLAGGLIIALAGGWFFRYEIADSVRGVFGFQLPVDPRPAGISSLEWCEMNYREEVMDLSAEFELPYEYLMALIVLECDGNKPAGHRYEKSVFRQLQRVRDGTQRKFEDVHRRHLKQLSDDGLKNLATSWGPFQVMGYKVVGLGIKVEDLRDEDDAAFYGVQWIKKEYGHYLKKKKWKDAFHFHNTGRRFPLSGNSATHDPYYVSDGIKYMNWFAKREKRNANPT